MKSKVFWWPAFVAVLVLAVNLGAAAQTQQQNFSGVINDYTPETSAPLVGPWQITGTWSLMVNGTSGKANFSASLSMVRSDYWVLILGGNPDDTEARHPHTHHISLVNGTVTAITHGFRVSGMATITGNGSPDFSPSPVQIDITGGSLVAFSNIALTFGDPADQHFGTGPLNGVVLH
jgi:hypothetical protein